MRRPLTYVPLALPEVDDLGRRTRVELGVAAAGEQVVDDEIVGRIAADAQHAAADPVDAGEDRTAAGPRGHARTVGRRRPEGS